MGINREIPVLTQSLSHLASFTFDISSNQRGQEEWRAEKIELFVKWEDSSWCLGCSQTQPEENC